MIQRAAVEDTHGWEDIHRFKHSEMDQKLAKTSNFGHFWPAKIVQNPILDQLSSVELQF